MKNLWRSIVLLILLLRVAPGAALNEPELYGKMGITPRAVRQGGLGSCHFHASIASLASVRPDLLRAALEPNGANMKVRFADGSSETVYPDDIKFARTSGYDFSDGLWVAALFRGYAQRALREGLVEAIGKSDLPLLTKKLAVLVTSSDLVLLAYDRAIRAQVDQAGNIDHARFKSQLRQELQPVPVDQAWKDRALDLLDSGGYFQALEDKVKENGELFGAYSSVGQGGMPDEVLRAFVGGGRSSDVKSADQAGAAMAAALQKRQAVVAWTRESPPRSAQTARAHLLDGSVAEEWFNPMHAYSVLAVNLQAGTVTLRNPWGHPPEPDGVFILPLHSFAAAYEAFSVSTPAPSRNTSGRSADKR
jgi:hypothetical protein